ncbi:MAG: GNAT family N-acetyltransferase [Thiothrix sp.]|uniref:GNAT family N-acetyltransferase n=1 Tax=Thiothrix sp. TaxID=1032 RepID=UPI002625D19D|nr:GNAT family N-acetyltransferase [Thiothrix sp.]MDD5392556.1 GNAT family N-acetyltransferase [Thiothrix sp.]
MLVAQRNYGIPIRKHYFASPEQSGWYDLLLPTAYLDCQSAQKPRFFSVEQRHTLLTDLTASEEAIFQNFPKDTRSQIRRSEQSGAFALNLAGDMRQFLTIFNRFATLRKLSLFTDKDLHYIGEGNYCLLTMDREGEPVIAHFYLLSHQTKTASILISVSDPQYNGNPEMRQAIGHANRSLHWQGMRHLKGLGFHTYDWCGYVLETDDPVMQGINRFKRTFNGTLAQTYNYYSPGYALIEKLRNKLRQLVA